MRLSICGAGRYQLKSTVLFGFSDTSFGHYDNTHIEFSNNTLPITLINVTLQIYVLNLLLKAKSFITYN